MQVKVDDDCASKTWVDVLEWLNPTGIILRMALFRPSNRVLTIAWTLLVFMISDWPDVLKLVLDQVRCFSCQSRISRGTRQYCYFCSCTETKIYQDRRVHGSFLWVSSISAADDCMKKGPYALYTQAQIQAGRTRNIVARAGHRR